MIIQQDETSATYQINRYEPGSIWVNQVCHSNSILIRPHQLISPWRARSLSDLTLADFEPLLQDKPKIVLLGTGEKLLLPPEEIMNHLFTQGIGAEFMDSRAACHTFTVLAAEDRVVAACILCI